MNHRKIMTRMEVGKRLTLLVGVGIPPIYHGEEVPEVCKKQYMEFLTKEVKSFDSGLFIATRELEESYRHGSVLAEMAVDEGISTSVIGFKALLNLYKSSVSRY